MLPFEKYCRVRTDKFRPASIASGMGHNRATGANTRTNGCVDSYNFRCHDDRHSCTTACWEDMCCESLLSALRSILRNGPTVEGVRSPELECARAIDQSIKIRV